MELSIIRFIQQFSSDGLDFVFDLITQFGEENILIAIIAFIYWNVDKRYGQLLAFGTVFTLLINNSLKELFDFDRPIGQMGIRSLRVETATGKAFPSGHTQSSSTFYTLLALHYKKRWLYVTSGILIFAVGISRIYLGVHYPKDIVVAWILGILIAFVCYRLMESSNSYDKIMLAGGGIGIILLPLSQSDDYYKTLGIMLGLLLSYFFDKRYVQFEVKSSLVMKVVRTLIGLLVIIGLKSLIKVILPHEMLYDMVRYVIVIFIGLGVYPVIFKRLPN